MVSILALEFGNIYKIYDEDLAKYMDAMVIGKEGKPIKLDTLLREQAVKLTGKESFWERRMIEWSWFSFFLQMTLLFPNDWQSYLPIF